MVPSTCFPPEALVSITASLMEHQEGARCLSPWVTWMSPCLGVQGPEGWPSLSLSCSQPTDRALLGSFLFKNLMCWKSLVFLIPPSTFPSKLKILDTVILLM